MAGEPSSASEYPLCFADLRFFKPTVPATVLSQCESIALGIDANATVRAPSARVLGDHVRERCANICYTQSQSDDEREHSDLPHFKESRCMTGAITDLYELATQCHNVRGNIVIAGPICFGKAYLAKQLIGRGGVFGKGYVHVDLGRVIEAAVMPYVRHSPARLLRAYVRGADSAEEVQEDLDILDCMADLIVSHLNERHPGKKMIITTFSSQFEWLSQLFDRPTIMLIHTTNEPAHLFKSQICSGKHRDDKDWLHVATVEQLSLIVKYFGYEAAYMSICGVVYMNWLEAVDAELRRFRPGREDELWENVVSCKPGELLPCCKGCYTPADLVRWSEWRVSQQE
jgi:hypothetical protein